MSIPKYFYRYPRLGAILSALLLVLAFPPSDVPEILLVAFVPLLLLSKKLPLKNIFALGGLLGALFYFGVFYWILYAMCLFFDLEWFAALPLYLVWVLFGALQFALFFAAVHFLRRKFQVLSAFAVASLWVCLEWVYPKTLPWTIGTLWVSSETLRQNADWLGLYGLSFVTVWLNACWVNYLLKDKQQRRSIALAAPILVLVLLVVYGEFKLREDMQPAKINVGMVHMNQTFSEALSWRDQERWDEILNISHGLVASAPVFMVWPEAIFDLITHQDLRERMTDLARTTGIPIMAGVQLENRHHESFNSVLFVEPGKANQHYAKRALFPFGEYLPFKTWSLWPDFLQKANRFHPGRWSGIIHVNEIPVSVSICLEGAKPGWTNDNVRQGAQLLVNVASENWSGPGLEPEQHMGLVQMRALETRRWMVRVTDGGISTTVDPKGFLSHSVRSRAGGLVEKVGLADHKTFYVRYGDWIIPLALLLLCGEFSWRYQRRKNS
jgi:apolipoprotein N-acyltransferase